MSNLKQIQYHMASMKAIQACKAAKVSIRTNCVECDCLSDKQCNGCLHQTTYEQINEAIEILSI